MAPLREKTPKRRNITTAVAAWRLHKPDLKIDFNERCAYCDSYDGFRHTWFEVDHFIPKDFFTKKKTTLTVTQYDNLVYSCKFCNNNKLNQWPSQSLSRFNNGQVGFVDPCDDAYDTHFYRDADGAIMWATELGKWMHTTAFKFDERERGIRMLWNLQRLKSIIETLEPVVEQLTKDGQEYSDSHAKLLEYTRAYFKYHDELINYYNSL